MSVEVWLTYLIAVLAFMVTPGPSHLLMLSNSMAHGFQRSLATAAGDLTANALQMIAAGLGLAAILIASQGALTIVKWLGVAYLLWMGIRMWRQADHTNARADAASSASLKTLWYQGFLTSAANPKAVVFFAALFPQFIESEQSFWPQFLILSVTYLIVDGAFLSGYGVGASWIASKLRASAAAMVHRIGSAFLIGAALMLGFKTLREAA
ncbi:LysE family translocator [Thalassococcus sp. S3]|uniref:LysE family translocator n=1 Tax=Thalassococcus sp. S3 TaxID=2017482 RepID=UPI00102448F3|nr:LysE family transporter [Thalassococcus sp. S3]QBF33349.1 lysine transporter LysE [Thalassococcus sp. S3]